MNSVQALNTLIEMRDFAEQMEKDLKKHAGPFAEMVPFACIHLENGFGEKSRNIHVHITSELLNHCVAGIEDSIRIRAVEDAKDVKVAQKATQSPAKSRSFLRRCQALMPWTAWVAAVWFFWAVYFVLKG